MVSAPRFFLSHSMLDASEVEKLHETIAGLGVSVYLAENDPQPGVNLASKVLAEIKASDAVIVLLAEGGASSPWVQQEIGAAMAAGKLVVPIVQAGVDVKMAGLAGLEYITVDFASPGDAAMTVSSALEPLVRRHAEKQAQQQEMLVALGVVALVLLIAYSSK
jgi:TIR domain